MRPMADIDVLIDADGYEGLESALHTRGYNKAAASGILGLQHGAPLYHSGRRVWLELHTRLFPESSHFSPTDAFAPANIAAQSVASSLDGRPVRRLSEELQLIYIACSWINDIARSGIHPSFLASQLDAIHLVNATPGRLDWQRVLGQIDNPLVAAALQATLACAARFGLDAVPQPTLDHLAASSRHLFGPLQRLAMQWMLDHCLVGARAWRYPIPLPVPARYSLRYQWDKRVTGRTLPSKH